MNEHSERMTKALKERLVKPLRERGFVGSYPHLRRQLADRIDYLMVQFSRSGGRFYLEVGRTGPNGIEDGHWADLPVEKITVAHASDRRRLTPLDAGRFKSKDGFEFGPRSGVDEPLKPQGHYDGIADEALAAFDKAGEKWLAGPPPPPPRQGPHSPRDPWPFRSLFGGRLTHLFPWNGRRMRIACVLDNSDRLLHRWENMAELVGPLGALIDRLPRPASIRSFQAREEGGGDWLPFGRMPWSEASNRKWTGKYLEAEENIWFHKTEIWSPSRSTWSQEGGQPELYVKIDWQPDLKQQGFVLALRHDQLPAAAEAADRVLDKVTAMLPGAGRIVIDRLWSETSNMFGMMQGNPLDYTDSRRVMEWAHSHRHFEQPSFAGGKA